SLALLVTGCGSVDEKGDDSAGDDGGDDAPTSDFSLVVDPTALTMPIASSTTVTVTVERDNFDDDIPLTAEARPASLAAVFGPPALTDGATSAELTVTAIGGMAPGTGSFEIVATAGSASRSADLSVTTTTITVSGKVRGAVTGATVGLVGKAPVTT